MAWHGAIRAQSEVNVDIDLRSRASFLNTRCVRSSSNIICLEPEDEPLNVHGRIMLEETRAWRGEQMA